MLHPSMQKAMKISILHYFTTNHLDTNYFKSIAQSEEILMIKRSKISLKTNLKRDNSIIEKTIKLFERLWRSLLHKSEWTSEESHSGNLSRGRQFDN